MHVENVGPDSTRPTGPKPASPRHAAKSRERDGEGGAPGADRVEISDAGRALAARLSGADAADSERLTVERIEEIRARIEAGFYDSPDVIEVVARRLAESGDLTLPGGGG